MKKLSVIFSTLMVLALLLAACASGNTNNELGTPGVENNDTGLPDTGLEATGEISGTTPLETNENELGVTGTITATLEPLVTEPMATETMTEATATPAAAVTETVPVTETPGVMATESPTQTVQFAANIVGDRAQLTRLSNLIGYELAANGETIGTVNDYIVNTCEAHIVYMVVDGDQGQMLVPFEVVTVNDGTLDADQSMMDVTVDQSVFADAPTITGTVDLSTTDWEAQVRDYWSGQVSLSNLNTECGVGNQTAGSDGTIVHKIAYASNLLGAELQTANEDVLGTIQDIYIQPESGQLMDLIVERSDGSIVMVPMRAVNIPDRAYEQSNATILELLTDVSALDNAPAIDSVDSASEQTMNEANSYWSEYVPLTPGG